MSTPAPAVDTLKELHDEAVSGAMDKLFDTDRAAAARAAAPPPPPPQPEPPPPPAPGTPPPPADPGAPPPPAPAPAPATPPPAPAALDPQTVDRIAEAVAARTSPPPPAPAPSMLPDATAGLSLTAGDHKLLEELAIIEELLPGEYKGIRDKMIQFWKNEAAWIVEWQRTHTGKTFDEDDEEYIAWVEANEPSIEPHVLELGKEERIKRGMRAEWEQTQAKERAERQQQEQAKAVVPQVRERALGAVAEMTKIALPQYGTMITGPEINDATEKAIREGDPEAHQILLEEAEQMSFMIQALEIASRTTDPNVQLPMRLRLKHSGWVLHPLEQAMVTVAEIEADWAKKPAAETTIEGRTFITQDRMSEMLDAIDKSNRPEEQKVASRRELGSRHWVLSMDDYLRGFQAKTAARVQARVRAIEEAADRRAKRKTPAEPPPTPEPPAEPPPTPTPEPAPEAGRRPAPAITSGSDAPNPNRTPPASKADQAKAIDQKMGWS